MKTGIELITEERIEKQIKKHGFTGKHHVEHPEWYNRNQLIDAARYLAEPHPSDIAWWPLNWDYGWFYRLCRKPHIERLAIAGALLAAEIDRIQAIEKTEKP